MLEDFPIASVLMSMPGFGIKTAAQILLNIGDGTAFESASHLAAHAGIVPVIRRSRTSIRGEFPARSGNKHAEGKHHNAAMICLARRRCNVIYAMLREGTYYQPPTTEPTAPAAWLET